ncbi:MAG: tyrosine-type recombinase/integrase [Campylobacterota bacterium]|nr:tyrosine-type recombinase/integrase [Campylobacterota bacterium]
MNQPLNILEEGIKRHSSIDAKFRKELLSVLKLNNDKIKIIKNKFKLDVEFYKLFVESQLNGDIGNSKNENRYYKNFKRLKKFNLVHKSSAYSLSRSLSLVSINPNHTSLLSDRFSTVDVFARERNRIIQKINQADKYQYVYIYIYLRCFTINPLSKIKLENILINNIIQLEDNLALQCYEEKKIFGLERPSTLYVYDDIVSAVINILKKGNGHLFNDIEYYEKQCQRFIKEKFNGSGITQIKYLNRNFYIFKTSPLYVSLYAKLLQSVNLTLSEVSAIYPDKIESRLLKQDRYHLDKSLKRNYIIRDEIDVIGIKEQPEDSISGVNISEIDELASFLVDKNNRPSKKAINEVISDIQLYLILDKSKHAKIFFEYVIYLLNFILDNKLRASTVKGYIYTLNKHVLKPIEDLSNIQQYEIESIHHQLDSGRYEKSSIKSIVRIVNRFFKFNNNKTIDVNMTISSYPKSIIFYHEFKEILVVIENLYTNKVLGKYNKLEMLQRQVIIILGFYSGMRKNELRSREFNDLYVYKKENLIYIDVNNNGLRKQKLKLKTISSKRRIKLKLDDHSMSIFNRWYELRRAINEKASYLFLERSKSSRFLNQVIKENEFNIFNTIIKGTTKRYTTFHSLRHSFATYKLYYILQNPKSPYSLIELAMELGHVTPEETLRSYSHAELLLIMSYKSI